MQVTPSMKRKAARMMRLRAAAGLGSRLKELPAE